MLRTLSIALITIALSLAATQVPAAEGLKSPDAVKSALQRIFHVTNDFDRRITLKTFDRLHHENEEFGEAAERLQKAVAGEPAAFKRKVDGALKEAVGVAQSVTDKSGTNDEAVLRSGYAEMQKKVNAVFALFPTAVQPSQDAEPKRSNATAPAAAPAN